MLESIIVESDRHIKKITNQKTDTRDKINEEIDFMQRKEKIIEVIFMESLKADKKYDYLFTFAEKVLKSQLNIHDKDNSDEMQQALVFEFFTGIISIIAFVVFKDKWCQHFNYEIDKLERNFLDTFYRTHMQTGNN